MLDACCVEKNNGLRVFCADSAMQRARQIDQVSACPARRALNLQQLNITPTLNPPADVSAPLQNMHSSVGAADTPTRERFPHPASGITSSREVCSALPIASVVFLKTNSSCDSKRSPAIDRRAAIRFSRLRTQPLLPCISFLRLEQLFLICG